MSKIDYFINDNFYTKYSHIESNLIRASKYNSSIKYSIIIPTFRRADLLKDAIDSCLNQTYSGDFEVLIVDNEPGRNNDTEKLIESIACDRISYYKNSLNIGCLPNFNRCIELAKSEYIIMLHTDDILDNDYLNTVIPLLEKHPGIDMLIPGKRILKHGIVSHQKGLAFLAKLLRLSKKAVELSEYDFCHYNITGGPIGIVMKKNKCLNIGGFNEAVFPMSDYAFWVRMTRENSVFYLPAEFGTYRFLENISSEPTIQQKYIIGEYKLINELIKGKPNEKAMSRYAYEYIRYRTKPSSLDRNDIFLASTGQSYKCRMMNKLIFIQTIVKFSISFIKRAVKSKIRI